MKHAIPHHAVLAGLIFCLAQSVAVAQWSSPGEFSDVKIQPSGTGQAQPFTLSRVAPNVNVPVLNNTGLEIKNPLGGIYLSLPAANGQPSTGGTFGVFKGAESMLYLQPGTSTNTLSIVANTSITGSLTVNGAGSFSIGSGTGAITLTGNNTGVSATGSNAVAIGGSNGLASGSGAVVIGGGWSEQNVAAGQNSTIIGSGSSVANSAFSTVIGALGAKILSTGSNYSAIIGGGGNKLADRAGDYNVIIGGANNEVTAPASMTAPASGGFTSVIAAGQSNKINGGHYDQAIIAGDSNEIQRARGSAIVGGRGNKIYSRDPADSQYNSSGEWAQNAILGGIYNSIAQDSYRCAVVGGMYNQVSGVHNAVISAGGAQASGYYSVAFGLNTIAGGFCQTVIGYQNVADSSKLFIIGNGASTSNRSNAFTVDTAGNATAKTSVTTPQLILTTPPDTSDISMGPFTQGAP